MTQPHLLTWLAAAVWVFWVGVDRRAWGTFQIHQPLVAGTVLGLVLGLPAEGLLAGAALQALWMQPMPVGGAIPPAGGIAACAAVLFLRIAAAGETCAGAAAGPPAIPRGAAGAPSAILATGLALAAAIALASWIANLLEARVRRIDAILERRVMRRLRAGRSEGGVTLLAVMLPGLASLLATAVSGWGMTWAGAALAWGMGYAGASGGTGDGAGADSSTAASVAAALLWPLLGIGVAGECLRRSRSGTLLWILGGFAAGILLKGLLGGFPAGILPGGVSR